MLSKGLAVRRANNQTVKPKGLASLVTIEVGGAGIG